MNLNSLSKELMLLPAKSNKSTSSLWLPAWMHMMDTAGTMDFLVSAWLPRAVQDLFDEELPYEELRKVASFLALTHDIGKLTPVFASHITATLPEVREQLCSIGLDILPMKAFTTAGKSPHALAGAVTLLDKGCPDCIVQIVGAHHGKPMSEIDALDLDEQQKVYRLNYYGTPRLGNEVALAWERIREEWFSFALHEAGYGSVKELPQLRQSTQALLTGLLIMSDWIASNTEYFPLISTDDLGVPADYPIRVEVALERLDLPFPWESCYAYLNDNDFKSRFGFYPNEVQREIIDVVSGTQSPGIYILEAQMGIGKTEAALAAAEIFACKHGSGGLFFGLPTQATANGIFPRLKDWALQQSEDTAHAIRLAHGMASLNEDYRSLFSGEASTAEDTQSGDLVVHSWFEGRKQALLADFVIGTVDQLLLSALKQKHVMLRHLGLAGKVVVIDECHAYDAYMSQYLTRALEWLGVYKVPVILLSATLPAQRRIQLVEAYLGRSMAGEGEWRISRNYPLLTWTDGQDVQSKAIPCDRSASRSIAVGRLADGDLSGYLKHMLAEGGCAGVIVNTVMRAQELADLIHSELPDKEVFVIHSHYIATDRANREAELLRRLGKNSTPAERNGLIVIGTQVMEQSLDVDFDVMVSDLCPMDLLLQRLGRLHRHLGRTRPKKLADASFMVLGAMTPELESGSKAVYGEWLLLRTKALLPERIVLPDDIPVLVQDTYEESEAVLHPLLESDDALRAAHADFQAAQMKKKSDAGKYRIGKPNNEDTLVNWLEADLSSTSRRVEASVRDGDFSIEVLVMMQHADGSVGFLPWQYGGQLVAANHVPSSEEGRQIAQQVMRLPHRFCVGKIADAIIAELERRNLEFLAEWQQSGWLHGELILLLDEQFQTSLCGYMLRYSRESGLSYMKEERNGIA